MRKIKTIIFDWGGVFCVPAEPFSHPKLLKALKITPDAITEKIKPYYNEYYTGKISYLKFWSKILNFFKLDDLLTAQELNAAYLNSYKIYPEMFQLLKKLKPNYRLALLSNLTKEMMNKIIKNHKLDQYFETMIFSNSINKMKP